MPLAATGYAQAAPDFVVPPSLPRQLARRPSAVPSLEGLLPNVCQAYNLRRGIALSVDQLALFATDIVWQQQTTVTLAYETKYQALSPNLYAANQACDYANAGTTQGWASV